MADPPSVAANATTLVGTTDIALRASKELYSFFSAIKDAPRDIILSTTELQAVSDSDFLYRVWRLPIHYQGPAQSEGASKHAEGL